ncbi:MAG: carboxypeptidase regulatory-like domain-containing protein, partial [Anaerolineae bacterium]|nr:carboxypeptidase regulatory-like domain-containing protein [Anaerolineae bacterium]
YALVLGNRARAQVGPTFFLMANIHARELTTPETALEFTRRLLQGYGTDPDATWMLDTQRTVVIVTVNPDGHRVAEQGYLQRKNLNNTASICPDPPTVTFQSGVDLNRNHSYQWGGVGASTSPCTQTYRGTSPASEVETQAVQEFAAALIPSRRADGATPVAVTTPNLLISLHSYGEWVLWPWGYTQNSAPEDGPLAVLGQRFAAFNGYTAGQASITLYDTSGDTTDWAYGRLGMAAYTIEIGTTFFQPYSDLPAILNANLPALRYAARVARAPYQMPLGPDLTGVPTDLGTFSAGTSVNVSLTADASHALTHVVGGVELKVDTPDWTPGTGTALSAADGVFNSAVEAAQGNLNTIGLAPGRHLVYARGRTSTGQWGPPWAMWLTIAGTANFTLSGQVTGAAGGLANARVVLAPGAASTTTAADGSFSLTVPNGTYTLSVFAPGYDSAQRTITVPGASQAINLTQLPCILVVDADPAGVALASWTNALSGLGQSYRTWRVSQDGSPRLNTLKEYGIVLWVGGQNGLLSEAQQAALQGYLQGGGHLLLSGQKLALAQLAPPFLASRDAAPLTTSATAAASPGYFFTNDLHFTAPQTQSATGLTGADFLSGLTLNLSGSDRVAYAQDPTALAPNLGGASVLRYGPTVGSAAVAYADTARRLVVLGFGLETVNSAASRQELLSRVVRWLGCPGDCILAGDVTRDGRVDAGDAQLVASSWLRSTASPDYVRHHDLDGNGRVDVVDITLVTRAWGQMCP